MKVGGGSRSSAESARIEVAYRRRGSRRRGGGVWVGVSPPQCGKGCGERACPPPQWGRGVGRGLKFFYLSV